MTIVRTWRKSNRKDKGLSAVIGMLFVLLIMLAVLIPLVTYMESSPTMQEQAIQQAQPYLQKAQEQLGEVNQQNSPVQIYYYDGDVYLVYASTPPVPVNASYFLLYNGGTVKIVMTPQPTKTTFNGYVAYAYQVGNGYSLVGLVTTVGNIIYADPYTPPGSASTSSTSVDGGALPPLPLAVSLNSNTTPQEIKFNWNQNPIEGYFSSGSNNAISNKGLLFTFTGNNWVNLTFSLFCGWGPYDPSPDTIYLLLPTTAGNPWPVMVTFNDVQGYWNLTTWRWVPGGWYMLIWTPQPGGQPIRGTYSSFGMFDVVKIPSYQYSWQFFPGTYPIKLAFHITQGGVTVYAYYQDNGQWYPIPLPDQQLPQELWNRIKSDCWGYGQVYSAWLNYIGSFDIANQQIMEAFNVYYGGYEQGVNEWVTNFSLDGKLGGASNGGQTTALLDYYGSQWWQAYWHFYKPSDYGFITVPGYNLTTDGMPIGIYQGPGYPTLPSFVVLDPGLSEIMVAWSPGIGVENYAIS
ncbi:MAG: hypothetical protein ASUL_03194 [Candidatus Aramenus sulfurataquae]|uniref:Uncharacterized protein n=1 Tax=Candidatus Aramenus sulfurataquae TaxID=1326980 RepID=W7KW16_9CREN|nr:MAG: hypothetical protein ASUL_03194 [Candidatus Aramenus sulfurataquae]